MLYVLAKRPRGCRRNVQNASAKRPTGVGETFRIKKFVGETSVLHTLMRKLMLLPCLLQVFVVLLFVCIYNMPRFFEYDMSCYSVVSSSAHVNDTSESNLSTTPSFPLTGKDCRGELVNNKTYQIVYENILYCLVVYLGPLGLLVFFNVGLIRELLQSHCDRRRSSGGVAVVSVHSDDRRERNNITLVMLVIIVIFLVTQTPAYVNQLLYYFLAETHYECGEAYFYYFHLSNLVVSSNSSLNFVVYCVCRRNFRRRLAALCGQRGQVQ